MSPRDLDRRTFLGGATALGAAALAPAIARGDAGERSRRDVALITGTSSGFGHLIALTLARAGYEVHASMRDLHSRNTMAAAALRGIARRERLELEVFEIDVRSERSVEHGVDRVLQRAGRIDVLVNNAGFFYPALLETLTVAQVQELFDTDVFGQLRMNRAALPAMRRRGSGLVVQVTSGVGRIAFPFQGAYNGAKWAMEAMAQVSRYELSQSGVDVVIVEPGAYPTDLIDNARIHYREYLRRLSPRDARRREEYGELARRVELELEEPSAPDPQEVADAVLELVRTPAGRRPLRTLVGAQVEPLAEINAVHQRIHDEIMGFAGYGDLIGVRPR
jgi:NAD(P)-dependent dehydrogenase (short-subunit alcohol dehydrogenase family)